MSKIYDIRAALAASIVAADIGWTDDTIIIKRQTDLWNDVATAMAASANGTVLHIGIAEGSAADDTELEVEVTLPLTILCQPQVLEGAVPEEDLWEALVKHVHDLRLTGDEFSRRFRFKSFADIEIAADGGSEYLGRQTSFKKSISIY